MKKTLVATTLLTSLVLFGGHASAADPVAEYTHDWSGIYIGLGGGMGYANDRATSGCGVVTGLRDEDDLNLPNLCAAIDDGRVVEADIEDGRNVGLLDVPTLEIDANSEALAFISESLNSEESGAFFGAQVGLNHQLSSGLVLGAEISGYKFFGIENSYNAEFDSFDDGAGDGDLDDIAGYGKADFSSELDWLAKATLRFGVPVFNDGRGLIYGAVGGAVAHVKASNDGSFEDVACDDDCMAYNTGDDFFQFGAVVGAGLDYMITESVSLGFEYNYIHFMDPQTLTSTYVATDGATWTYEYDAGYDSMHMGVIKLNYMFN